MCRMTAMRFFSYVLRRICVHTHVHTSTCERHTSRLHSQQANTHLAETALTERRPQTPGFHICLLSLLNFYRLRSRQGHPRLQPVTMVTLRNVTFRVERSACVSPRQKDETPWVTTVGVDVCESCGIRESVFNFFLSFVFDALFLFTRTQNVAYTRFLLSDKKAAAWNKQTNSRSRVWVLLAFRSQVWLYSCRIKHQKNRGRRSLRTCLTAAGASSVTHDPPCKDQSSDQKLWRQTKPQTFITTIYTRQRRICQF